MRTMLVGVLIALMPGMAAAQVNTTGSLGRNTTTALQTTTGGTTMNGTTAGTTTGGTTAGGTTTGGTTTGTVTGTTGTTTGGTTTDTTNGASGADAAAVGATVFRDAAIVICGQEFSTGASRLLVFSASTSSGAPAVTPGAACAQGLSDLFVAGFQILDVVPFNQQLQYTLVR